MGKKKNFEKFQKKIKILYKNADCLKNLYNLSTVDSIKAFVLLRMLEKIEKISKLFFLAFVFVIFGGLQFSESSARKPGWRFTAPFA